MLEYASVQTSGMMFDNDDDETKVNISADEDSKSDFHCEQCTCINNYQYAAIRKGFLDPGRDMMTMMICGKAKF